MKIIETIEELRTFVKEVKASGRSLGLVPTMGALHEGHLTLMRQAKQQCEVVVVSIFVNPTQFGPQEDFTSYPRDLAGDSEQAASAQVDAIFHPAAAEMYPAGYASYVEVEGLTDRLCGLSRPGHFRGVTTVVTKLFQLVQPDVAFFGQKDAQQALIIGRMIRDLNMPVRLDLVPIVREADGLALSSRNRHLSAEERESALVLSRSLRLAQRLIGEGERDVKRLRAAVADLIAKQPLAAIEYVELCGYPDLAAVDAVSGQVLLALAVKIGQTRLIDNAILEVEARCS